MSNTAKLDVLTGKVGYHYVRMANSQGDLKRAIMEFGRGPGFILAKIELGGRRNLRRPLELAATKNRFMLFMKQSAKGDPPS